MECPSCGAPAAADAAWCSLCFYRFANDPVPVIDEPRQRSAVEVAFASQGARRSRRIKAVMFLVGGPAGGFLTWAGVSLLAFFLTWGDDPGAFPLVMGIVVALGGVGLGVLLWIDGGRPAGITLDDDMMTLAYPGFVRPLSIPRGLVRLVAIDDRPVQPFRANHRFRVAGDVPPGAFADALDAYGAWRPPPITASIAAPTPAPTPSDGGWATVGAQPIPQPAAEEPWLFRGDGAALPVLRVGVADVPNVAILFHEKLQTPRPPLATMLIGEPGMFLGGRSVHGVMVRLADTAAVDAALGPWGVVRAPTVEDVLDEGLQLTKPLRGWRIPLFTLVVAVPVIIQAIARA